MPVPREGPPALTCTAPRSLCNRECQEAPLQSDEVPVLLTPAAPCIAGGLKNQGSPLGTCMG